MTIVEVLAGALKDGVRGHFPDHLVEHVLSFDLPPPRQAFLVVGFIDDNDALLV